MESYEDLKSKLQTIKNSALNEKNETILELINVIIGALESSYEDKTLNLQKKNVFFEGNTLEPFFETDNMELIGKRLKELRTLYNEVIEQFSEDN